MKNVLLLFWLYFCFVISIFSETEKINILILNFLNKNPEQVEYNFLGKKIAQEFESVLSKSKQIQIFPSKPISNQLELLYKKDPSLNSVLDFLKLYKSNKDFTHILFGEFEVHENQIFIDVRLKNHKDFNLEKKLIIQFPELQKLEYWQLQACAKATYLAEQEFAISIYDAYTRACLKPNEPSLVQESSYKVYRQIQEIKLELSKLEKESSLQTCNQNCVLDSEEKSIECLQTCPLLANLKEKNLEISQAYLSGYFGTEEVPRDLSTSVKIFREKYLDLIIQTLKNLPENSNLIIQGKISKKYSQEVDIFEKSRQKALKAKEILEKEILEQDKNAQQYLNKLKVEACADICFQEYPSQVDSSARDNDVTFRIRVNNKK